MPHTDHPSPYPNQHPPPFGSRYPSQAGNPPQQPFGYPPQAGYQPQSGYTSQPAYPVQTHYQPQLGYPPQTDYPPQTSYPPQQGHQFQSHHGYTTQAGQPMYNSQSGGYPYLGHPVHSPYGSAIPFGSGHSPYQSAPNPIHSGAAAYPVAQGSCSTAPSSIPSTGYPSNQPQYNHQPPYSAQQLTLPSRDIYPKLFGSGISVAGTKSKVGLIDIVPTHVEILVVDRASVDFIDL